MRRVLAAAVLVPVLLTACGSTSEPRRAATRRVPTTGAPAATESTTTTAPPAATTTTVPPVAARASGRLDPRPGAPLVISDAGNSILFDAEPAITASLGAARLKPHTIGAFGLSVLPEVWRGVFGNDVPGDNSAAVVVMLGNRDFPAALADPDGYRRTLDEAVRLLSAKGARILWLGLPPLPPNPLDALGRNAVNALFAELPARFPGVVRYVPTDSVLGNPDGTWARTVAGADGPIRKVKPDGSPEEHLCPAGAARVAELIRTELSRVVPLPPAPAGWQAASWRGEPRYDDPPGACR